MVLFNVYSVNSAPVGTGPVAGLVTVLDTSLVTGLCTHMFTGLGTGLVAGPATGLVTSLVAGLVTGLVTGLFAGLGTGLVAGLGTGLSPGLVTGLVTGMCSLRTSPWPTRVRVEPCEQVIGTLLTSPSEELVLDLLLQECLSEGRSRAKRGQGHLRMTAVNMETCCFFLFICLVISLKPVVPLTVSGCVFYL